MDKDQDILAFFVENDRKQKRISLTALVLFLLLAVAIISLAFYIQDKNKIIQKITEVNVLQGGQIDSLVLVLQEKNIALEIANSKLKQDTFSLNRTVEIYQEKHKIYEDSLTKKQEEVSQFVDEIKSVNNNPAFQQKIQTINPDIIKWIETPKIQLKKPYTIYIQYMNGFEKEMKEIQDELKEKKYTVPAAENISNQSFDPTVRYFKDEDKNIATELAESISSKTRINFKAQFVELKSAKNQLEIWIGIYEKPIQIIRIQRAIDQKKVMIKKNNK